MKNNLTSLKKSYPRFIMVAFASMLFIQSNAQNRDRHGGGDHQRNSSSNGVSQSQVRHEQTRNNFPQSNNNGIQRQRRDVNTSRPSNPQVNNNPGNRQRSYTPSTNNITQRPGQARPREIVHNNTTINRTNIYENRSSNHAYGRPGYNSNYRRPVYSANNPSLRYSGNNFYRRNSIVTSFPYGYQTINYGGYGYRYCQGNYYRPYNNSFIVVGAPIGIFINTLPFGYRRIVVRDNPYYYYNGTYYDQRADNNYSVVAPPLGAVVESIPEGYETIVVDGQTYYNVDGVQYKPVVQDNGEIWYEVIKVN
ncbi:MAG: DUF6515 family protein [Ferruginibacter sp.]